MGHSGFLVKARPSFGEPRGQVLADILKSSEDF